MGSADESRKEINIVHKKIVAVGYGNDMVVVYFDNGEGIEITCCDGKLAVKPAYEGEK